MTFHSSISQKVSSTWQHFPDARKRRIQNSLLYLLPVFLGELLLQLPEDDMAILEELLPSFSIWGLTGRIPFFLLTWTFLLPLRLLNQYQPTDYHPAVSLLLLAGVTVGAARLLLPKYKAWRSRPRPEPPVKPDPTPRPAYRTEQLWARRVLLCSLLVIGPIFPGIIACAAIWHREEVRIRNGQPADFTWFLGQYFLAAIALTALTAVLLSLV